MKRREKENTKKKLACQIIFIACAVTTVLGYRLEKKREKRGRKHE